jgi:aminopeptidase N
VVSNTPGELLDEVTAKKAQDSFSVSKQMLEQYGQNKHRVFRFDKCVPISTYLYCMIAGAYAVFTPSP